MVPAPTHMLQEFISLQQPYMGKRSRLAADDVVSICSSLVFQNVQLHEVGVSIRSHQ